MKNNIIEKIRNSVRYLIDNRELFDPRKNFDFQTIAYFLMGIFYFLYITEYNYRDVTASVRIYTVAKLVEAVRYDGSQILRLLLILLTAALALFVFLLPFILYVNHVQEKQEMSGQRSKDNMICCLIYLGYFQYMIAGNIDMFDLSINATFLTVIIYYCIFVNYFTMTKYKGVEWKIKESEKSKEYIFDNSKKKKMIIFVGILVISFVLPIGIRTEQVYGSFFDLLGEKEYAEISVSLRSIAQGVSVEYYYAGVLSDATETVELFRNPITFTFLLLPIAMLINLLRCNKEELQTKKLLNLNVLLSFIYPYMLIIQLVRLRKSVSINLLAYAIVIVAVLLFKGCVDATRAKIVLSAQNEDVKKKEVLIDLTENDSVCFCRMCGKPISKGIRFCPKCGHEVKDEDKHGIS